MHCILSFASLKKEADCILKGPKLSFEPWICRAFLAFKTWLYDWSILVSPLQFEGFFWKQYQIKNCLSHAGSGKWSSPFDQYLAFTISVSGRAGVPCALPVQHCETGGDLISHLGGWSRQIQIQVFDSCLDLIIYVHTCLYFLPPKASKNILSWEYTEGVIHRSNLMESVSMVPDLMIGSPIDRAHRGKDSLLSPCDSAAVLPSDECASWVSERRRRGMKASVLFVCVSV